jgi:integrase
LFNPSYLTISRHRVYYFRWPLPRALHPLGKVTILKVSLRTRDPKQAISLSRHLGYVAQVLVNVRTLNKYIQTYVSMFGWAKRNSFVQENPFEGLTVRQGKNKGKHARSSFSKTQVERILEELVDNRSGVVRLSYQKWGPLIALYTGARLNEIAQIHLNDILEAVCTEPYSPVL